MKPNKLIVMSIDALMDEDLSYMRTLPNFERIAEKGAWVRGGVRSIYPALTYPCHVSMITGTYPHKHGIFHNEIIDPTSREADWYWYRSQIQVPTILNAAHEAGLTTACLGWPCMGGDPASDWMVPEIWSKRSENNLREVLERASSSNVLQKGGVLDRYYHVYAKLGREFVDQSIISCACALIREESPDVMFLHVAHLDHMRHAHGVSGPAVEEALVVHDDWLGRVMDAAREAGTYDETNFAIVSDHGHLAVNQMLQPNVILAREGLIDVDNEGRVLDWRAWCNSAALSSQVHLKDPGDGKVRRKLERILDEMRRKPEYGIEAVFCKEELEEEQKLTGSFSYVLEGTPGTSFGNACTGEVLVKPDDSDYKFAVSSHGHLPYKGGQPVWVMAGPDVKENAEVSRKRIVDEAPTFAKMLGIHMPQAEGSCITELLKEGQRG